MWPKNGPKPTSKKNVAEDTWLMTTSLRTANNLEVNMKAGNRDFGLNTAFKENKISESLLRRKYA